MLTSVKSSVLSRTRFYIEHHVKTASDADKPLTDSLARCSITTNEIAGDKLSAIVLVTR